MVEIDEQESAVPGFLMVSPRDVAEDRVREVVERHRAEGVIADELADRVDAGVVQAAVRHERPVREQGELAGEAGQGLAHDEVGIDDRGGVGRLGELVADDPGLKLAGEEVVGVVHE